MPDPSPPRLPVSLAANPKLSSWLKFSRDGQVTVSPGKVEIRQGIVTALAQIAADELDIDLSRVQMVRASTSASPNEGVTSGSLSIQQSGRALRHACAEVRNIFLQQAAERLARLGYRHVHVEQGDGSSGWAEHAPYDAIVVAAGAPQVPEPLQQQLAIGGRLVIPVGADQESQQLVRVTRQSATGFATEEIAGVRFVPLIGQQGWPAA